MNLTLDFSRNAIVRLFGLSCPVVQGGMVWNSGWRLAAAVSNAGGLGLIGAGSMDADTLRIHIRRCREATSRPFGVNVPLLYRHAPDLISVVRDEGVPIVFTSAGSPRTWTGALQSDGVRVAHVVSSSRFALKAAEAGVDAVVAEGFEAGGHNGAEETTTLCLVPAVRRALGPDFPLLAAGGVATGAALLAVMALGADGAQVGSRFAATAEGSGHERFKQAIVDAGEGDTRLQLKALTPVRLLRNAFAEEARKLEDAGADRESLAELLGRGRSRRGMFEGDLNEGELEIGQVSALIDDLPTAGDALRRMLAEYAAALAQMRENKGRFG